MSGPVAAASHAGHVGLAVAVPPFQSIASECYATVWTPGRRLVNWLGRYQPVEEVILPASGPSTCASASRELDESRGFALVAAPWCSAGCRALADEALLQWTAIPETRAGCGNPVRPDPRRRRPVKGRLVRLRYEDPDGCAGVSTSLRVSWRSRRRMCRASRSVSAIRIAGTRGAR
jgi:hypothetical protein